MKNLRVSKKLTVSFLIATLLTGIVGIVGINGLLTASNTSSTMYESNTVPLPYMSKVIEDMQRIRVNVRQYVIHAIMDDTAAIETTHSTIESYKEAISENLDAFGATIVNQDVREVFSHAKVLFNGEYNSHLERVRQMAISNDYMALINELDQARVLTDGIVADFEQCMALKVENAAQAYEANQAMTQTLLVVIVAVLVVAAAISLLLAAYLSRIISKPLIPLSNFMKRAGTTGDLTLDPEDVKVIEEMSHVKDEIGQTIAGASSLIKHVTKIADELKTIANGDLTVDIKTLSEADTMGNSLMNMSRSLNRMFGDIQSSTEQVSAGAKQVADGAQGLAQGATEQAASMQELSSTIAGIAIRTRENAETAERTSKLSDTIKENAEKGNRQMNDMMAAVQEINDASHSIGKIIKTIDDIAFQTNILALNAAVEAARAGQHGKGFAVVAEEVRHLAAKSAEAAKETGNMIQNTMKKAEFGSNIAGETASSLSAIVDGIKKSSSLIAEIAKASEEQSTGISQINTGIDQVTQVVQQNSATAQQSAAASQEMSSQSAILSDLISHFSLKEESSQMGRLRTYEHPAPHRMDMHGFGDIDYVPVGDME